MVTVKVPAEPSVNVVLAARRDGRSLVDRQVNDCVSVGADPVGGVMVIG